MSKLMEYALEKECAGKYQDAINYYEMVMEEKGCPFDIRKDMGRVLNKMGQYEDALSCFDLVLMMDEKHTESWFGKGISNLGLGNWGDAFISFVNAINFGDNQNANNWYYIILLNMEFPQFSKQQVAEYSEYFKKFDDECSFKIRSQYKFGLQWEDFENRFENSGRVINIKSFKRKFKAFGVNEDQINSYLRTLSYDELIKKIKRFKEIQYEHETSKIIFNEFKKLNLSDDEINNMFELESLENLKNEVISLNNEVTFPILDTSVNIPKYVKSPFAKHIYENATNDYKRVENLSKYNTFCKIMPPMRRIDFINISGIKGDRDYHYRLKKKINRKFALSQKYLKEGNINKVYKYLKEISELCPIDYYVRVNILFYLATFYSKYAFKNITDYNRKLLAFKMFESLIKYSGYFVNADIFILNLANVANDLSFHDIKFLDDAIKYYSIYLQEYHPEDLKIQYVYKSLRNHKLKS